MLSSRGMYLLKKYVLSPTHLYVCVCVCACVFLHEHQIATIQDAKEHQTQAMCCQTFLSLWLWLCYTFQDYSFMQVTGNKIVFSPKIIDNCIQPRTGKNLHET